MTDATNDIPDEVLAEVSGGSSLLPREFRDLLQNVQNP